MARLISGVVLVIWGFAILVSALFRDTDTSTAYGTGQMLASVFAVLLVAAGGHAILKGRAARG